MQSRAEEASRWSEFDPFLLTGGGFLFTNKTGEVYDVISGGGIKFWRCALNAISKSLAV
jgi:1-phosphatidylinositol-4-phosphate 5-kinase